MYYEIELVGSMMLASSENYPVKLSSTNALENSYVGKVDYFRSDVEIFYFVSILALAKGSAKFFVVSIGAKSCYLLPCFLRSDLSN